MMPTTDGETSSRRLQVLVVDDNKDAADSLGMLVRLGGHEAHVVYSGQLAILKAEKQTPDVVLLDIGLPRMDGYQVVQWLRNRPDTKDALIIAITGFDRTSDRERSKEAGFDLHLVKPVDSEKLVRLLNGDPALLIENQR